MRHAHNLMGRQDKGNSCANRARFVLPGIVVLFVILVLVFYFPKNDLHGQRPSLAPLFLLAITAVLVLGNLFAQGRLTLTFDLTRPLSLYSFFFFLYYVVEGFLFLFSSSRDTQNHLEIMSLILAGYVVFWYGIRLATRTLARPKAASIRCPREYRALLLLCYVCASLVIIHYAWLASQGAYYTHALDYEQPATLEGSFLYVFAGMCELPIVFLLALVGRTSNGALTRHANRFMLAYVTILFLIYVTSSQFRLALTLLVFLSASLHVTGGFVLRRRHVLAGALGSLLALFIIQATRVSVAEEALASSGEQVVEVAKRSFESVRQDFRETVSEIADLIAIRATLPLQFLSDIVDVTRAGRPHTHGLLTIETLVGLIPRALWRDKPIQVSTQLRMERHLGLPDLDNSPSPITLFYTEFGWPGVILGYAFLGWFLGAVTTYAVNSIHPGRWMVLAWVWGSLAMVETDAILGVLMALRQVVVVYLLYRLFLLVIPIQREQSPALPAVTMSR
ncbi:MAG: oligosaccharide repeat unit polymerase [Acidobacteriia bacterium]|nr:oligosaccharide repeat unit polymerase [Terriglobia bacterium]